jgi:hypothetical protein
VESHRRVHFLFPIKNPTDDVYYLLCYFYRKEAEKKFYFPDHFSVSIATTFVKSQWVPSQVTCLYKRRYVIHTLYVGRDIYSSPAAVGLSIRLPNSCRTHTHTDTHIKMRAVESVSTGTEKCSWP